MKKVLVFLSLILFVSLSAEWLNVNNQADLFDASSSRSLESTTIEFELDGYNEETVQRNGVEYKSISYQRESEIITEGMPNLPSFTRLIAIPNYGEVEVSINSYESKIQSNVIVYPRQALQSESHAPDKTFKIDTDYYRNGAVFPAEVAKIGTPAIFRDFRVVSVTINPFRFNPKTNELEVISEVSLSVRVSDRGGENTKKRNSKPSRSFQSLYKSSIINYDEIRLSRDTDYQNPSYLFIHPNNTGLEDILGQLTEWKHQKGFDVHTANTMEIGSSNTAIKDYIQNAYYTWENPPEYVVLVGDAEGTFNIPHWTESWSGYNGGGDHHYAQLEGDDILADVSIGRLSISNLTEMQTIVNKIFFYEKTPYMESDWFERVVLVGDPTHSGQTTIDVNVEIGDLITDYNEDFELYEEYDGNWVNAISTGLNAGASYFNYRGWLGMSGFDDADISSLNNGPQLPYATILTCDTGTFYSETSSSEVFLRAGTPSIPKGAIGAIGVATSGTHTCFNNSVDYGIYYGIFSDGIHRMGDALLRGKLNLYEAYPDNPSNKIDIFSYWTNLMGDPGLDLWTQTPEMLVATYDTEVGVGTNYLEVIVIDENGFPVENAWVAALMGDDDIFQTNFTDVSGRVILEINAEDEGEVRLTVTKPNYIPHLGSFDVTNEPTFVGVNSFEVDDAAGNNDGFANPGETFDIEVTLENLGTSTVSDVTAAFSSANEYATINTNGISFGNMAAGAEATASVSISLDPATPANSDLEIAVEIAGIWNDFILLPVAGVNLRFAGLVADFDSGYSTEFPITLENIGTVDATNLTATLESTLNLITVIDSEGSYDLILADDTSTNTSNPFVVHVNNNVIPGTQFEMILHLTSPNGFEQNVNFFLEIGEVAQTDPLGPDAGGYVCYDSSDIGYYMTPEYNWIEINAIGTEMNLTDTGNMGVTQLVDLPFTFRYYGVDYDQITICTNGWIAPGEVASRNYMNWPIPGPGGPSPLIAPFWDDLISSDGNLYYNYDNANHQFIVEWDNYKNEYNGSEPETFQVIFYDPDYYQTTNGNGNLKFQYKDFGNIDAGDYSSTHVQHGAYATIGLKDHTGTKGLEYSYYNQYPTAAMPLGDETAILFTEAPRPLEEPLLVLDSVVIDDVNGMLDYGETVDFNVLIKNIGENLATSVSAVISSDAPYITINNNSSDYNDVSNGYAANNLTAYNLSVTEDCPNGYEIPFVMDIESAQQAWQINFSITVNAPVLDFTGQFIEESNNNVLDPGEEANLLMVFTNSGGAAVFNAGFEAILDDDYVTLNDTEFELGNILPGASVTAILSIQAADDTPTEHLAEVGWAIAADQNVELSGLAYIVVSQVPIQVEEFFDTFLPTGWTTAGVGGGNWSTANSSEAGGTAPEARLTYSPNFNGLGELISAPINTLGSLVLNLEFKHKLSDFTGTAYSLGVKSTSDGGGSWNEIWSVTPTDDIDQEIIQIEVDISDTGSTEFQLAFYLDGDSYNINNWYIDDVIISGGSVGALGYATGNVTLSGDGDLSNVQINVDDWTTQADEEGNYYMAVMPGEHVLTASLSGYQTFTEDVIIETGETTELDIVLVALEDMLPPSNLAYTIDADAVNLTWDVLTTSRDTENNISVKKKVQENKDIRNHLGYRIYRNNIAIAEISSPATLLFIDTNLITGIYEYYVTSLYTDGESIGSNTVEVDIETSNADDDIPLVTSLNGNYPNPFNPTTKINFALHIDDTVVLKIYNIKGQKVKTLVNHKLSTGHHSIIWNGKDSSNRDVASGVYFYKMKTSTFSEIKQMVLMK